MLRILSTPRQLCDGVTRRDLLHVGGLSLFGLSLSNFLGMPRAQASPQDLGKNFGKAKACILLFPFGSPPQHETFDPKPEAPLEIRGELGATDTSVPGIQICDHLPRLAQVVDRMTIIRSVTHPYPLHGVAYALSGIPLYDTSLEANARDPRHWPCIGSIVDWHEAQRAQDRSAALDLPRNIGLPWPFMSKSSLPNVNGGPFAAFLGQKYDPYCPTFVGPGTKIAPKVNDTQTDDRPLDPFAGLTPEGHFSISESGQPTPEFQLDRLNRRKSLLDQFDTARRKLETDPRLTLYDRQQQAAFSLLTSSKLRDALDVGREPQSVRDQYGMTLFGQSCLAARRLVEAGSKFITVFWDAVGLYNGSCWDTHANHFPRLKEYLLPGMDFALSGLILDLEARGMLDDTLIVWLSEHGRTPQIDSKPKGAARHHWSRVYSVMMAGGGVARGKVVGSSDKIGGDVRETPVSPKDLLATSLHLLGIDPHSLMRDLEGRPHPLVGESRVRNEFLS